MSTPFTGGCQCGAVRFRVNGELLRASICHCRMCQKASGGFYMPLVAVKPKDVEWTRGAPGYFQSSNHIKRGFCSACGTPLTYEPPDDIALAIGAFDHPETIEPIIQFGTETKLPYTDTLHTVKSRRTFKGPNAPAYLSDINSYQHPDHDTDRWPPQRPSEK